MLTGTVSATTDPEYNIILNTIKEYNPRANAEYITNKILESCDYFGVQPLLVTAMFAQESTFDINAGSNVGAFGIAQLMPETADSLGVNRYDVGQNIYGGVKYLSMMLNYFASAGDNQITYAVAAYNAGPGAIEEYHGVPPYNETINYLTRIGNIYDGMLRELPYDYLGAQLPHQNTNSTGENHIVEKAIIDHISFFKEAAPLEVEKATPVSSEPPQPATAPQETTVKSGKNTETANPPDSITFNTSAKSKIGFS